MEAVTSLISAGADVNDVNQVRHGVLSVSPHTWSDGLVCLTTHVCHHTEGRVSIDGGCQEW